jgi:ketosteroid isomerase-like protein
MMLLSSCTPSPEIRLAYSTEADTQKVKRIFQVLDNLADNLDSTMSVFSDDVVHMGQGNRAVTDKTELRSLLERETSYGDTRMVHELISIHSYPDMVLTRGRVKGTWTPPQGEPVPFETNNIITFRRLKDGSLKIWHVIFNRVALENYPE